MAKRFTDIKKWRNEWFRTLPLKARLTWIYLCDECDFCGVWKADYGLASFQLGFSLDQKTLVDWFGDKIYCFSSDKILIVQFFEFQYGESKDSWTAKVKARQRLENLGFSFVNDRIFLPQSPHSPPTVDDVSPSVLIVGVGVIEGVINKNALEEKFDQAYNMYPVRVKGSHAQDRFKEQIKTEHDYADLLKSIGHYIAFLSKPENDWRKPKQSFATYLGTKSTGYYWRDFIDKDAGSTTLPKKVKPRFPDPPRINHKLYTEPETEHPGGSDPPINDELRQKLQLLKGNLLKNVGDV